MSDSLVLVFSCSNVNETSHVIVELWSHDADILFLKFFFLDDSAENGNSLGGCDVVTSNHSYSDSCLGYLIDSRWYLLSDDIHDSKDSNEDKVVFLDGFDV